MSPATQQWLGVCGAAIALGLLMVAAGLGLSRVREFAQRNGRRTDDPAFDPSACPYGERPGFSAEELRARDMRRLTDAERGARS